MKLILLLLLYLVSRQLTAAESFLEKSVAFPANSNGIARYRIPGIVVTTKGTVLAYAEARKNNSSDWGEIEVHLRRSLDGGKTWAPAQSIAHRGARIEGHPHAKAGSETEQTVNNPVAIVDRETGAVEFLYCVNYARCFSIRSLDDGLTWSAPREITATFEPFRGKVPWKVIATGPGHGLQLKGGRLVVPVWVAYGKEGAHSPSAAGTIYSDDHGQHWQAGELCLPNEGALINPNETMITELSDGRVLLVARSVSRPNRKLITISPDGAKNWSPPAFHDQLWEPVCMASILTLPSHPGTLIFSNPHTLGVDQAGKEIPAGRGKRENLTIKLSRDDGQTWPLQRTLEAGRSAYSDLAVLPNGTLLCLYEGKADVQLARFNLEWISVGSSPQK